jgi:hypothetical protein
MTYSPSDMLHYNPAHRVLICRECQYAIQKSAVSSHLLRHKIYRNERQRLLSYVAGLELLEPESVSLPTAGSLAIEGLSIVPGYCCVQDACGNLCASLKRMKRHQSEIHGVADLSHVETFARPAMLQTFFRGTKLRYFEVTSVLREGSDAYLPAAVRIDGHGGQVLSSGNGDDFTKTWVSNTLPAILSPQVSPTPCQGPSISSKIELGTLAYFYHYTTATSLTLPTTQQEPHFWQTKIVHLALKHEGLMCGLLAISACHLSLSTIDPGTQKEYCDRSRQFTSDFATGLDSSDHDSTRGHEAVTILTAGKRLHCILQLASWSLDITSASRLSTANQNTPFAIHSFITTLKNMAHLDLAHPPHTDQQAIFARAKVILDTHHPHMPNRHPTHSLILERLRILPSQLSEVFGRPDHVQDVLATLSATAALAVSCETSYESNALQGIVGWLSMVTEHFDDMLSRSSSAASVLVAHWAILVIHAANSGLWFVQGLGEEVVRRIVRELDSELLPLVRGLVV